MLKKNFSVIIKLVFVSMIAVSSVALVYILTKSRIISQKNNYQKKILNEILPNLRFENLNILCYTIKNKLLGDERNHKFWMIKKQNNLIAVVFEAVAPDGYSGNINMIISLTLNRKILGVRVLEHHETPGLGDKIDIRISDWITKFSGMTVLGENDPNFSLKKYGGKIDQFTGATITPLSIINAIKRIVYLVENTEFKHLTFKHCKFHYE
ncbi:MAG: electron transport complex subunit RsxG [Buchnera aphidicola (Nurudea yanoniella)]